MSDYIHSGSNKMNKVEAYKNDNKLLLADKLGHAKVSSLKEQNLINTINTVATHDTDITQLKTDMNKVRGAYVYKGTVETEFDLPLNNNSVGDVYNVSLTGMNYAWNGENWDELGYNNLETKLKTWTTEQIGRAISLCEERLRFDPVPVYDVTLAEDITPTGAAPYHVEIDDAVAVVVCVFCPEATNMSSQNVQLNIKAQAGDAHSRMAINSGILNNGTRQNISQFKVIGGLLFGIGGSAISGGGWAVQGPYFSSATPVAIAGNSKIGQIDIWPPSGYIPADTIITIYATKEV